VTGFSKFVHCVYANKPTIKFPGKWILLNQTNMKLIKNAIKVTPRIKYNDKNMPHVSKEHIHLPYLLLAKTM